MPGAHTMAASQAHAGLILVSAKTFPQDRSYTAAITGALSALLDQPGQIQPGHVLSRQQMHQAALTARPKL